MTVRTCPLPAGSRIAALSAGADFADCHALPDPAPDAEALQSYLDLVARTPGWMNALMALRNGMVRLVGLKALGQLGEGLRPAAQYRLGDRVGIFQLHSRSAREVVLEQDDRHLLVRLSLFKADTPRGPQLQLSTVVHEHNRLGRLYMAVVGPVHRRIVPRMLEQAQRHG